MFPVFYKILPIHFLGMVFWNNHMYYLIHHFISNYFQNYEYILLQFSSNGYYYKPFLWYVFMNDKIAATLLKWYSNFRWYTKNKNAYLVWIYWVLYRRWYSFEKRCNYDITWVYLQVIWSITCSIQSQSLTEL